MGDCFRTAARVHHLRLYCFEHDPKGDLNEHDRGSHRLNGDQHPIQEEGAKHGFYPDSRDLCRNLEDTGADHHHVLYDHVRRVPGDASAALNEGKTHDKPGNG